MIEDQNIPSEQIPEVQQEKAVENILREQSIDQPPTEDTQIETEKMELHTPHHVMHKKNWKE